MKNKFNTEICDNNMSFQECELAIVRQAIDNADKLDEGQIVTTQLAKGKFKSRVES